MNFVYLDHNVITPIVKSRAQRGKLPEINRAKSEGCRFPYSPAHIEEIAVIYQAETDFAKADGYVTAHLNCISSVTDDLEFLPCEGNDGPARIVTESPFDCMNRVIAQYDLTRQAEEVARFVMSSKSSQAFEHVQADLGTNLKATEGVNLFSQRRQRFGIATNGINNLTPEVLFTAQAVRDAFDAKLSNHCTTADALPRFTEFETSFQARQNSIMLTLNFLEEIGYRADSFRKWRSQMHDVSHAIYGSLAEVFVTADERYRIKLQAAYRFLDIPTRILSPIEFDTWVTRLTDLDPLVS